MDPYHRLNDIRSELEKENRLSPGGLRDLIELCRHPGEEIQEAALTLLLHPPVADELAYYRRLVPDVFRNVPRIVELPPAFIGFICELSSLLGRAPGSDRAPRGLQRMLERLPRSCAAELLNKSLPLEPLIKRILPVVFSPPGAEPSRLFRRKWRLFRRAVGRTEEANPVFQITWSDLRVIWCKSGGKCLRPFLRPARWRPVMRALLLPAASSSSSVDSSQTVSRWSRAVLDPLPDFRHGLYFAGWCDAALGYFEKLMHRQAAELSSVRELAFNASRRTRRVVLSWHNATLAAAGGWAFEELRRQFPAEGTWRRFLQRIDGELRMLKSADNCHAQTRPLLESWKERLIRPKVVEALWRSRVRAAFDESWKPGHQQNLEKAKSVLESETITQIVQGRRFGWPGAVSPYQQVDMDRVLKWLDERELNWAEGLMRLAAMVRAGQRLIDEGALDCLVLPWIDKFFISSRRLRDIEYLPSLVGWIERACPTALVLLWEDTGHVRAPSLQLALQRLREQGFASRGIGAFDSQASDRREALHIISKEHASTRLFALRPCGDEHCPRSFHQLIENRDHSFFECYDSSWKDNLSFIYAGTRVFPLLSVQSEMEALPAWVAVGGRRYPFGAYFRRRMRGKVLGKSDPLDDGFSAAYASWANLC